MNLRKLFHPGEVHWDACVAHFGDHGLILPGLPAHLAPLQWADFRHDPAGSFVTSGWSRSRSWSDRIDDWVSRPITVRAWLGVHRIEGEPVAELDLVSPYLGLFMRHRWPDSTGDASESLRVQGACRMAGHLLTRLDALLAGHKWPEGQRLLLIDDGLDLPRWGWIDAAAPDRHPAQPEIRVMRASHMAYFDVMSALDAVAGLPLELLPGTHAYALLTETQPPCRYPPKPIN